MNTFHELSEKGVVSLTDKMGLVKGANWKPLGFLTQKNTVLSNI